MNQKGVSLVESLLVVVMVGLVVFLLANLPNAINLIGKSRHLSLAREIATKQIEDKREISYANLTNDNPADPPAIVDPRLSLLPVSSGTVLVEDCDAQICTNDEHVKQITVTVNWKDNGKQQIVTLKTFIAEGGLNQ